MSFTDPPGVNNSQTSRQLDSCLRYRSIQPNMPEGSSRMPETLKSMGQMEQEMDMIRAAALFDKPGNMTTTNYTTTGHLSFEEQIKANAREKAFGPSNTPSNTAFPSWEYPWTDTSDLSATDPKPTLLAFRPDHLSGNVNSTPAYLPRKRPWGEENGSGLPLHQPDLKFRRVSPNSNVSIPATSGLADSFSNFTDNSNGISSFSPGLDVDLDALMGSTSAWEAQKKAREKQEQEDYEYAKLLDQQQSSPLANSHQTFQAFSHPQLIDTRCNQAESSNGNYFTSATNHWRQPRNGLDEYTNGRSLSLPITPNRTPGRSNIVGHSLAWPTTSNGPIEISSSDSEEIQEIESTAFNLNGPPPRNQFTILDHGDEDSLTSFPLTGDSTISTAYLPGTGDRNDTVVTTGSTASTGLVESAMNAAITAITNSLRPRSIVDPLFDAWMGRIPQVDSTSPSSPSSSGSPYSMVDANGTEIYSNHPHNNGYSNHGNSQAALQIKNLLENIRPDADLPACNREGTPAGMRYPLMEHQKLGLAWLKNMEEGSNKGGILADDMGLGKTIQALALLVSRPSTDPDRKTTLIVAPVALMKQWEREIETKINETHRIKTFIYHGGRKAITWEKLKEYDVVLTTFGTLGSEYARKHHWQGRSLENPQAYSLHFPLLSEDSKVIIDEAQCIKNRNTKAAQAAYELKALTRFCLTGTPMMNNVGELHSLIQFLRIAPYCEFRKFNDDFTKPIKAQHPALRAHGLRKLQALLKAILLRRTKKSEIDGKPILTLPERSNEVRHAVFSEDERAFYTALETKTQLQFNKYMRANSIGRNYSNVLVLLLRLRQACCHPHLIHDFEVPVNSGLTVYEMHELAKEFPGEVVTRIREAAAEHAEGFECPVCYDAVENPAIFIPCGHDSCSECLAKLWDQRGANQLANGNDMAVDAKCPSCRGKITPMKIIDYATFKRVHMKDLIGEDEALLISPEENEGDSDSSDSDSDSDLSDFVVADDVEEDANGNQSSNDSDYAQSRAKAKMAKAQRRKDRKGKEKRPDPVMRPKKSLAELKKDAMRNESSKRKYMRRLEKGWEPSAKVDKCVEILENIQNRNDGEKTIVFSQFTSLLDLLEVPISKKQWGFKRYDGSMTSAKRNDAVIDFTDNPAVKIMLVSLKAGNSGLNLVAASQVIILDPFWNPFIEEQAIDRAHRIGQLRPVQVHRLLVQETVEDRIIELQNKKRELIEGALDEKASQGIARLGARELAFLFVCYLITSPSFEPSIAN
ncbi:MAG: hypothetical protein M1829_002787 [Trizodia sp. TS-e1964]|nr:MAG: hypothetical protein M1829_002787 [Trizodia sp. TS-e1964]